MTSLTEGIRQEKRFTTRGTMYFVDSANEIVAKACSKCGKVMPIESFNMQKVNFSGRYPSCKLCIKEYARKYQEENYEKIRSQQKEARKHPSIIDKRNEYARDYHKKNADMLNKKTRDYYKANTLKAQEYARDRYKENAEKLCKYGSEYKKKNPEKVALYKRRRRARKKGLLDTLTTEQWEKTVEFFDGGCALTGKTEFVKEHALPLKIGHGGTTSENIIPMCGELNHSKSALHIFEWFSLNQERFNISQEKFDTLIEYLAQVNDMTKQEYRAYVDWCFDNPVILSLSQ